MSTTAPTPTPPEAGAAGVTWGPLLVLREVIKDLGLPTALLLLFLYWGQTVGAFMAPLAVRLVEATEVTARQTQETGRALERVEDTTRRDHDEIKRYAIEAREAAQRAELAARK